MNILRMIDFILEDTTLMVINELFFHVTLHSIALNGAPLSSEDSGFVMGQVFDGLNYLHEQGWVHGNVDPRSILVLARDFLFIKLADTALSGMADLGKPDGYHDLYASQNIGHELDQYPKDIFSAGVVGLHLLHGKLPERTAYTLTNQRRYVAQLDTYVNSLSRKKAPNDGLHFLAKVIKAKIQDRPTAKELLEDPWIQQTRNYQVLQFPESRLAAAQGSRHTSVGLPNTFGRQSSAGPSKPIERGMYAPGSHQTSVGLPNTFGKERSAGPSKPVGHGKYAPGSDQMSVGLPHTFDRQSSAGPSKSTNRGEYAPGSRHTSVAPSSNPSRQSSTDPIIRDYLQSHPYPGDDWNNFDSQHDSQHETTLSQSSRFTANPLAREPRTRTPTPYDFDDKPNVLGRSGSLRSWSKSPGSGRATGTVGRVYRQREAEVEEDDGEVTETDEPRKPVKEKPPMNLRSHGKGRR